jgi:hypothetical protein
MTKVLQRSRPCGENIPGRGFAIGDGYGLSRLGKLSHRSQVDFTDAPRSSGYGRCIADALPLRKSGSPGSPAESAWRAALGFLEPQTGGPFTNASFSGAYGIGTTSFPTPLTPVSTGIVIGFGDGTLAGVGDSADSSDYQRSVTVSGTYNIPESGRGDYVLLKFYMISPTKAIIFEANDAQHQPTVISVEQ